MRCTGLLLTLLTVFVLGACGGDDENPLELGLEPGLNATMVADGLMNPSGVSFDKDGNLAICDAGNGKILLRRPDVEAVDYITGFETEYWKVDPETKAKRFKLGPINAAWLPDGRLAVSNAGLKDGEDHIAFFEGSGAAISGEYSNGIPSTTGTKGDLGEGNPTGFAVGKDGNLWACGQGSDMKSWILRCDVTTKKLETWASSDDNGISVNSPMQILVEDDGHILVLYSGAGGKEDGLIARWNVASKKPVKTWTLPGLVDPMGMDFIPGTKDLAVVDNNWALTEVKEGRLARVSLGEGDAATVKILGSKLRGPVACAFGPDKKLYVAQLGREFDKNFGAVVAISGIE
jgi:hypothetical protein